MKLASRILDIINEMAAPYRSQFIPGKYKVYVEPIKPSVWNSYDSMHDKVVFGEFAPGALKDRAGVQIVRRGSVPREFGKRALEYIDNRHSTNLVGYVEEFGLEGDFLSVLEKTLMEKGWKDITNREKMARDREDITHRGMSEYATGWKREQTVEKYVGKVYHGTPDKNFINLRHDSDGFGKGSHLTSLNSGDALSITPNIEVARGFMDDANSMVVEFDADLTVYYASRVEDDLDEIEYPPECDAVAIPFGRYEEDEFAVVRDERDLGLRAVAVYLYVDNELKRYPINEDKVIWQGPMRGFLLNWIEDCFGSWELRDALRKVEYDIEMISNGSGAAFRLIFRDVLYYIDCSGSAIWDEEDRDIFLDDFIAILNKGTE